MNQTATAYLIQLLGQADDHEHRGVTALDHALRLAHMLERRSRDPLLPFAGLVHDLARPLTDDNPGAVIAELIRPNVPPYVYYLVRTQAEYQHAVARHTRLPHVTAEQADACAPHNLRRLCLLFAGCDALTYDPDYVAEAGGYWTYDRARQHIIDTLN